MNVVFHSEFMSCPFFFRTPEVSDQGLQHLIARGLDNDELPKSTEPAPTWPPEGPKVRGDGNGGGAKWWEWQWWW